MWKKPRFNRNKPNRRNSATILLELKSFFIEKSCFPRFFPFQFSLIRTHWATWCLLLNVLFDVSNFSFVFWTRSKTVNEEKFFAIWPKANHLGSLLTDWTAISLPTDIGFLVINHSPMLKDFNGQRAFTKRCEFRMKTAFFPSPSSFSVFVFLILFCFCFLH